MLVRPTDDTARTAGAHDRRNGCAASREYIRFPVSPSVDHCGRAKDNEPKVITSIDLSLRRSRSRGMRTARRQTEPSGTEGKNEFLESAACPLNNQPQMENEKKKFSVQSEQHEVKHWLVVHFRHTPLPFHASVISCGAPAESTGRSADVEESRGGGSAEICPAVGDERARLGSDCKDS